MALSLDGTTGISATGNIISSAGIISATGNIYGGNIIGTLVVSTATFSGNVTGGNLLTGGLISAAGAITTGGDHSLTGNIVDTGPLWINTLANGNINLNVNGTGQTNIPTGILSVTGNIQGGNLRTAGIVSATGNITGSYILGNGSQLTGVDATQIINGTSNARVVSSGGNIAVGIGGTSNVVVWATTGEYVTGVVSATGNVTAPYFIGNGAALTGLSASKIFNGTSEANIGTSGGNANITIGGTSNVFVVATTGIYTTGLSSVTGNITGGNLLTGGLISATSTITSAANVTGGNLLTGGLISATSTITGTSHLGAVVSVTANITGGNLLTAGIMSAGGNIFAANIIVTGGFYDTGDHLVTSTAANANIVLTPTGTGTIIASKDITNGQANGVGNIGNATGYFNTIFGKATTAQYADLAELYSADAKYEPGTVLVFGGNNEVTISTVSADPRVAGVVSTNPAHLMNSVLDSEHKVAVALTGRVPTSVTGTIRKGDMMVTAGNGVAQASAAPAMGTVIGKALENFDGVSGTIEIVVGRL